MARILEEDDIVHDSIQSYLGQSLDTYSRFFEGAPVFVTYYSKDHFSSTSDVSLGTVSQVVGADSPVKFNQIDNIPLYRITGIDLTTSNTEFGNEAEITGEAIVVPNTIKPRVDDYFAVFFDGVENLYRISDVTSSRLRGKRYTKITFYLSSDSQDQMEEQVNETFEMVSDGSAPEKTVIVKKDTAKLIEDMLRAEENMQDLFIKIFYNQKFSDFGLLERSSDCFYCDMELRSFIDRNALMTRPKPYRNEIFFIEYDVQTTSWFGETFYTGLEKGDVSNIDDIDIVFAPTQKSPKMGIFYQPTTLLSGIYTADVGSSPFTTISLLKDTREYINNNIVDAPSKCAEIVKIYSDRAENWEENVFNIVANMTPRLDLETYFTLPIAMFVLRQSVKSLSTGV